ncbi:MAG: Cys-tRNA(Pro) deacylase [Microbacteriaceae bacterium]
MSRGRQSGHAGTPAALALETAGIRFIAHQYEHDAALPSFGLEAASALRVDPERVFKTLVVQADAALVVAIVPVNTSLDLKRLAAAMNAKRARMADPELATRKTGYVLGGISPFGQKSRLPTILDATADRFETILVSGGRRGFDLELAPADLLTVTGGRLAAIGR